MPPKREKILFLITKAHPWGGAQRYVFDLATSLKGDYEAVVAVGGEGRLTEMLAAHSVRTIPLSHLKRNISLRDELRSFRDTWKMLRRERPDILHLNSSKAGGLGALAGRLAGVKTIVFTAHAWAWNEDRSFISRILIGCLHTATVLLAHRTICVSHAVYDQMARIPFTRKRMRVVHPGIAPAPRIEREKARAYLIERAPELASMSDRTWIGTVGELHPIKGHRYALQALELLAKERQDFFYIALGDGEAFADLQHEIGARDLRGCTLFMGHVDDASALLPAFDLLLVPSLSEAFGYVVVEGGAAGVPVIASRVGGIPEIMEEDMGILVPQGDPEAIKEAIEEALRNPQNAADQALALQERVFAYFTKERMVEETAAVYRGIR